MRVAVAGSTGAVGRKLVEVATSRGHDVVSLARSTGVDLAGGVVGDRLAGADAVVDVTNIGTRSRDEAEAFFGSVTRTLLEAERAAGVRHHVALSIVGIDDVPTGYYLGKRLQERLVAGGDVPWSVLRATQFHEFAEQALYFATVGPFSLVPRMLSQPIAAAEVAAALVALVESGPAGKVPDLAGPERLQITELARKVSRVRGLGRRVVPVRLPGEAGRAMREGALCPSSDGPRGTQTFDAWLATR